MSMYVCMYVCIQDINNCLGVEVFVDVRIRCFLKPPLSANRFWPLKTRPDRNIHEKLGVHKSTIFHFSPLKHVWIQKCMYNISFLHGHVGMYGCLKMAPRSAKMVLHPYMPTYIHFRNYIHTLLCVFPLVQNDFFKNSVRCTRMYVGMYGCKPILAERGDLF